MKKGDITNPTFKRWREGNAKSPTQAAAAVVVERTSESEESLDESGKGVPS